MKTDVPIAIAGLGYVGLPLALHFAHAGVPVIGLDVDAAKVGRLARGESYILHIPSARVAAAVDAGRFTATTDLSRVRDCQAVIICVPTPLKGENEPDLSYVLATGRALAPHLAPGTLVVLESTTYPGTTRDVVKPLLEASGLKAAQDFFLAFSPEREDPGNPNFHTSNIPKVVGADDDDSRTLAAAFYGSVVESIVPVVDAATAESVKLVENIFRSVNIALVNELKVVFNEMGINVWDVIDAAKTKPFGFMPFYPGPGLGGHCIPIDPFYLSWKAREFGVSTRFIELAGEINRDMPRYVVTALTEALSRKRQKSLNGARILLVGLAYKKNVDDLRESPALTLLELMEGRGATVEYYDPYIPEILPTREHAALTGRKSVSWDQALKGAYDAVLISTDHDEVDHAALVAHHEVVVDTRNATRKVVEQRDRIVLA